MKLWQYEDKQHVIRQFGGVYVYLVMVGIGLFSVIGTYGEPDYKFPFYLDIILAISGVIQLLFRKKIAVRLNKFPEIEFERGSKAALIFFLPLTIIGFFDIDDLFPPIATYIFAFILFLISAIYYIFYSRLPDKPK